MLQEIDRSTSVRLPDDRPLSLPEAIKLWTDHVPDVMRKGRCDTNTNGIERQLAQAWGWLLNRIYWDENYLRAVRPAMREHVLEHYRVPDVCKPGGNYCSRRYLDKLRHDLFDGADYTDNPRPA